MENHLLPNGTKVIFYPETHTYVVDGKELPSITTLLDKTYGNNYAGMNPEVLKVYADYGTAVHAELSDFIEIRKKAPDFPVISAYPEVENYFTLVEDIYHIKPILTEKVVVLYDENNVAVAAGRFDLLCTANDKLTLVDFKTTSTIHRQMVTGQLNLYLKAAKQSGYIPEDEQVELGVIQLNGQTSRMVPIPVLGPKFYLKFIK